MDGLVPGHNSGSVIDLINSRISAGTESYNDGRRLALIVEGGAMRGVLSAGCVLALEILGCCNVFDEVYGTSAGAVNAAYFLASQCELGISIYFDDISSLRFVNPLRFWKILDLDLAYDHIIPNIKMFDEAAIRTGRPEFFVSVTNVESGQNVLVDAKTSPYNIVKILKATAALPVLYNRLVKLGNQRYVDGGLSDLLPVAKAASRGCTDILVLSTRLETHKGKQRPLWERIMFLMVLGLRYPEVNRTYVTNFRRTLQSRAYAMGRNVIEGTNIATICPTPEEFVVSRVTCSRPALIDGARKMAIRTANIFGRPLSEIEQAFARLARGR
jgi:predicted patatin/cPLA2 family phospholipase